MGLIITTIFDAMRIRETRFSGEMAGAVTIMKGWCGLENSEGKQFKEPRREPERMDAMARLAAGVAEVDEKQAVARDWCGRSNRIHIGIGLTRNTRLTNWNG